MKKTVDSDTAITDDFFLGKSAKELRRHIAILRKYGVTVRQIEELLDGWATMNMALADDIVRINPDEWRELGVNIERYVLVWLDQCGYRYIKEPDTYFLWQLPNNVSAEKLIDYFTMSEIMEVAGSKLERFLRNAKDCGCDEKLREKAHDDKLSRSEQERLRSCFLSAGI